MIRYQCDECGFVWFYPCDYIARIEQFKSGSAFWNEMEDNVVTCKNCGHSPFPESRWWLQTWRPGSDNYWRKNNESRI